MRRAPIADRTKAFIRSCTEVLKDAALLPVAVQKCRAFAAAAGKMPAVLVNAVLCFCPCSASILRFLWRS